MSEDIEQNFKNGKYAWLDKYIIFSTSLVSVEMQIKT